MAMIIIKHEGLNAFKTGILFSISIAVKGMVVILLANAREFRRSALIYKGRDSAFFSRDPYTGHRKLELNKLWR